eukprot:2913643-Pyramimonas_sp.AAC.1
MCLLRLDREGFAAARRPLADETSQAQWLAAGRRAVVDPNHRSIEIKTHELTLSTAEGCSASFRIQLARQLRATTEPRQLQPAVRLRRRLPSK